MGRSYKFYISGSMSGRFFQKMWEELPTYIDDPGVVTLSNPIRNNTETTFDLFIANDDGANPNFDYTNRVDTAKEWINENQAFYEVGDIGI